MMKPRISKFHLFVFLTAILLCNCAQEEDNIPVIEVEEEVILVEKPDTIISVNSFLDIPTSPGIHQDKLQLTDGTSWDYKLSVPDVATDQHVALVIGLVWAGQVNAHRTYFDCLLELSFSEMNAILFAPADKYGLWSNANVEQQILEFINYARLHWPINPDQIVITGYSIGGTGSWYYAINHDSIIAASIPMASAHPFNDKPKIPIYGICGGQDDLVNCAEMEQLVEKGTSNLSAFEVETNLSHFDACNYSRSLTNAARWLDNTVFGN